MALDMVLNEVSLMNAASDISTAQVLMSELFETMIAFAGIAGRGNLKLEICKPKGITALYLAPEYPVGRWMNDRTVDERQRRLFITIAANSPPFIDDINDTNEEDFLYRGKPAKSLGYAYLKEALAISLKSEACWDCSHIELQHHYLNSDSEFVEDLVDAIHASHKIHIQEHALWIKSSLQAKMRHSILNGSHLWERREELFPHLQFCKEVEAQLQAILSGSIMLDPIYRKLSLLEQFCANWPAGHPFESKNIGLGRNVSPESEATLKKHGDKRMFTCPDGVPRCFTWHVKFNPDAWRIHFLPIKEQKLVIGYIGRHLPIVTS